MLTTLRDPACDACALCNSSVNVCVMGRGNPSAKFVLIGEAPGAKEAETGKPFMGAAGKLLTKCLAKAKVYDGDYYVTNINKCRPPGNRAPTDAERTTCTELYLYTELAIIRPWVIVLLGGTASKWAFPNGYLRGQKNLHSDLVPNQDVVCIPTFHPAYYLHSGDASIPNTITQHLAIAKRVLDKAKEEYAEAKRTIKDPDR